MNYNHLNVDYQDMENHLPQQSELQQQQFRMGTGLQLSQMKSLHLHPH